MADEHVGYWSKQKGNFEHDRFQAGFYQGWDDAHLFFHNGMELGLVHEWMLRRQQAHIAQRGQGPAVWEFGHGFKQGVARAAEACLGQ
jgi:glucan 1,3-beta-glucosidase